LKTILTAILLLSGSAMAIEEPDYAIVSKNSEYEVRQYGAVIVAETKVVASFEKAGNEAFQILAGYIFGGNKSKTKIAMTAPVNQAVSEKSEKIAMTAPVNQSKTSTGYLVQFTMPKSFTLDTLPIPNDSRVELRQIPARTVAVFSYSGSWSESRYQEKLTEFLEALKNNSVQIIGEPVLARYNSPFQLWFLRRNEIWVDIKNITDVGQ
jgi:effector-binding domain-containing protein